VIAWDWTNFGSATWGTNGAKEFNICFVIVGPLCWQIILVVNGFNWTNRLASTTVNTLIGVDVEHTVTLIDAVHRTFGNTGLVLDINTWQRNNVSQLLILYFSKSIISLEVGSIGSSTPFSQIDSWENSCHSTNSHGKDDVTVAVAIVRNKCTPSFVSG